jgi:ribosomal protein L15
VRDGEDQRENRGVRGKERGEGKEKGEGEAGDVGLQDQDAWKESL